MKLKDMKLSIAPPWPWPPPAPRPSQPLSAPVSDPAEAQKKILREQADELKKNAPTPPALEF